MVINLYLKKKSLDSWYFIAVVIKNYFVNSGRIWKTEDFDIGIFVSFIL